jgi:hypothetical protein
MFSRPQRQITDATGQIINYHDYSVRGKGSGRTPSELLLTSLIFLLVVVVIVTQKSRPTATLVHMQKLSNKGVKQTARFGALTHEIA